jgi:DNA polymerase-4
MERSIIHLNIADFAVAVETNLQPALKGYPLIIAPQGAPRAVVYDMSDEAYKEGIRKGMPLARATRLNRKIKILPPSFNRYELVMKDLIKQTFAFTPLIESGTTDGHIFMDITQSGRLFGPPMDVAFKLKKAFKNNFNLDPIWSVATNKLVAKVATRIVKPIGEYIVSPGDEESFLAPLPIHLIPGLLKTDLKRLMEFNLWQVDQARALSLDQLTVPFSSRAPLIYERIRGIDKTPVKSFSENQFLIRADHEFNNDTNNADHLRKALYLMVETICHMLRKQQLHGASTKIILSYSDGMQSDSKLKLSPATSNDMTMFKKCTRLLDKAWTRRVRIRHMRLICEKLSPKAIQNELFVPRTKENHQTGLIDTMDKIRKKFGKKAVTAALTLVGETPAEGIPAGSTPGEKN